MKNLGDTLLKVAEIMDAWRVIPRAIVASYGFMIYKLFLWYTAIPTHEEKQCNSGILNALMDNGVTPDMAMEMACTVVNTVGGPTTQQTSFVTVIIGLSSAMFAFYVNSGGDNNNQRLTREKVVKVETQEEKGAGPGPTP